LYYDLEGGATEFHFGIVTVYDVFILFENDSRARQRDGGAILDSTE
jgi:hypothetical protein